MSPHRSPGPPVKAPRARIGYKPRYESDEVAVGIAIAIGIHAIPIALLILKATFPNLGPQVTDDPVIARPVIGATLLKLGKPIDPSKLPDRIVPQARTAPAHTTVANRENEPPKKHEADAGPPPPNTKDSDITNLAHRTDAFAEDAGKARPEQGFAEGVEGGTETDPTKVHAGDMYAAKLGQFLHDRWQYPTVISQGEANKLCVVYQVSLNRFMVVWHVRVEPIKKSGNELFDDSAHEMLQKLLDDRTPLPEPPAEVQDSFRGRTVNIALSGDLHGDSSKCR